MGQIPVEGPTTTTGLQVVETLHAYGAFGLEPSVVDGPVWISIPEAAPYGAEVGRCQTQTCENDEEAEVLVLGQDYDAYEGWYFVRTTAGCYDQNGELRDEVIAWLYAQFCAVIPECSGEPTVQIVAM